MVHLNIPLKIDFPEPEVFNDPCQHAFVLVGLDTIFGVHMTQYHCEKHKYQLILQVKLSEDATEEYRRQRALFPDDTFILCNRIEDKCTIPSLGSGQCKKFTGAIYRGFRPPKSEPPPPHWFPWNDDDTLSVAGLGPIDVTIERVVIFRRFFHNEMPPPHANYFLWGAPVERVGGPAEAHMTNFQTARLLTGPFEVPEYGIDYDHVMSLKEKPSWLSDEMLIAGIPVSVPSIPRYDPETGEPVVLLEPPMKDDDAFNVMYRGVQPPRAVVAGHSFLWATAVCNSESLLHEDVLCMNISAMPKIYWV